MPTASDVLRIARAEVGYDRYSDPERGTKYGRWYEQQVDGPGGYDYGANGVAYCAMFASWVLDRARVKCAGFPGAYCPSIHHKQTLTASQLKAGDIVLFDWEDDGTDDHVGIVVSNDPVAKTVETIEGNTSGGKVAVRTRAYSTICGGIRPDYDGEAATTGAKEVTQQLVVDVADGKWGNDPERRQKLEAAGYDYEAVRLAVNAWVRGGSFGAAKPATYLIAAKSGVNVRTGAGTGNAKTGKAYAKGAKVEVLETKAVGADFWGRTKDGWFAIRYGGDTYAKAV
ncbi:CHAP domain-containing protein [uncultured Adlercreutzia sp.]|uniref:CHAP domain-containing protein n=1 Tax=uncultured Adlercreutzia sp. TaxID=875803 RepID=UPI0025CECA9D|nr:CHAP domain-containing protein [uncultured Adlercreutzia sp.]